ncbi:Glycine receptor subunit alpha-1, partial [Araneus ventricosus]
KSDHSEAEDYEEEHHEDETEHHEDHYELINSLFNNYDQSSSPTHGTKEPVAISVNIQLISVDDVSDARMELIIDTRMTLFWDDKRLMTPECRDENRDCDDHFDLKRREQNLWKPDLYILNSRSARQHEQPLRNGMVYLVAQGRVILSKRLTLTLRCPMNLVNYPLDTQSCPLIICPYSLPDDELTLQWTENGVGILDDSQDGQNKFHLLTPIITREMTLKYSAPDVTGSFSCVNATFSLKRQNGYHMGYSYTITSFIVIVSWIGFWLPVTAVPARVTLGVTTLLTLLTTGNFVRSSLPPISYVTAIDVWVRRVTDHPLAYEVCRVCGGHRSTHRRQEAEETGLCLDRKNRIIFPLFFLVFNISYWTFYLT